MALPERLIFTCFVIFVIAILTSTGYVALNIFSGPCEEVMDETEKKKIFIKAKDTNLDYLAGIGVAGVAVAFIFGMVNNGINAWGQSLEGGDGTGLSKSFQRIVQGLFFALTVAAPIFVYAVGKPALDKAKKEAESEKGKGSGGGPCGGGSSDVRKARDKMIKLQVAVTGTLMFGVGLVLYVAFFGAMDCALSTIGFVPLGLYAILGCVVIGAMLFFSGRYFFLNRQCLDQVLDRPEYAAVKASAKWPESGSLFTLFNKNPCKVQAALRKNPSGSCARLNAIVNSACTADTVATISLIILGVVAFFCTGGLILTILSFVPPLAPDLGPIVWANEMF